MLNIRTILHPTDFSAHSAHAFRMACALARDYHARLIVLHVWQPSVVIPQEPITPVLVDEEAEKRELEEQLRKIEPPDPGVSVQHRLVKGDPADEILRTAAVEPCDLIVMGTHGRRALRRLLMGSVAEQVVRKAPCLVLTVKSPLPEKAEVPEAGTPQPAQV
jgi:nucleotide-binding universal stress UspA family protein